MVFKFSDEQKNAVDGADKYLKECDKTLDESKNEIVKTQFLNGAPGIFFGRNAMFTNLIRHSTQFTNAKFAKLNLVSDGSVLLTQAKEIATGGFRKDAAKRN